MSAAVVFGLSVIACRNFVFYYRRALFRVQEASGSAETARGDW